MSTVDLVGGNFRLAPIELANKPIFDSAFSSLTHPLTDYTFASTFMWGGSLALYWKNIDRHLCVFANGTGDLTMLMPPLPLENASDSDLRTCIDTCFDIMDEYNDRMAARDHSRIEYVSSEMAARISAACGLVLRPEEMSGDYIYDMQRMIDLAGGSLKSKRHSRSKFMRDFPNHRTAPLTEEYRHACLALLECWCKHGDDVHVGEVSATQVATDVLRHRDLEATRRVLNTYTDLGLVGMVLLVDEKLVGFTLGEPLTKSQVSILIEKTHPDYHGSAQFIFSEFCRQNWSEYAECNVGDDWGIPSLKFTKESYKPIRRLDKQQLTREPAILVAGFDVGPASLTDAYASASFHSEVVLREATLEDLPAILEVEQVCFESSAETFHRRQVRTLIQSATARVMVAEDGNRIVGWSAGLVRRHPRSRSGRIYNVAVHPEYRGQRIGRRLVEEALRAFAADGIHCVYLEVREDNEVASQLYRSMGFADHRQLPDYYGTGVHARSMLWTGAPATAESMEMATVTAAAV